MSDLRARYENFLRESGAFEEISERPTRNSVIVKNADGEWIWAEPIDPDCKIGRVNSWMYHVPGAGWFLPTGTIVGRVPAEIVEQAHAEALAMNEPAGLSPNMRAAYVAVRNAGKTGLPSSGENYHSRAMRALVKRGLVRTETFMDTYTGPGLNNGSRFLNHRYFLA